jgi:hypothetical protein
LQQKEVGAKVAGGPHGPAVTNRETIPLGQGSPPAGGALHWKRVPPSDKQTVGAEKPVARKLPEHTPLASERSQHIGPSVTWQVDEQKGPPSHASPGSIVPFPQTGKVGQGFGEQVPGPWVIPP